jgi:thiamine kinase-like enzyme
VKEIGTAASEEETRLEAALAGFGWRGRYGLAAPAVVSPVHRGVANACFRVEREEGGAVFVKLPQPDLAPLLDPPSAAAAARAAAGVGASPAVAGYDPESGALATAWLGEGWDYARNDALSRPEVLEAALGHKRRIHAGPPMPRRDGPFERIARLEALLASETVHVPADLAWMRGNLVEIEAAMAAAGTEAVPCHLDQPASNVMLGPDGAVLLVDFDSAGMADPWYDLGGFLTEAFQFDEGFHQGIEIYAGATSEALFARAKLWSVVDDFHWALWATWCFATSPRTQIEFFKYASWRFLRARMTMLDWRFETWLRKL